MNKRTKIILIRHGQSLGNASRTILGHTDLDLSEQGYKQAYVTAEFLKNEKIDKIYSSDLKRAYNTALPHAKTRNLDIVCSKNLREMYVGAWENMKVDDIIKRWGRDAYEVEWFAHFGTFKFPDGESVKEGGWRFFNEIKSICEHNIDKTILITAHAAVIRAFWAIINNTPWDSVADVIPFASNASFSVLYYQNGVFEPEFYSFDEHLTDVGITKVKIN